MTQRARHRLRAVRRQRGQSVAADRRGARRRRAARRVRARRGRPARGDRGAKARLRRRLRAGGLAYRSGLPVDDVVAALRAEGIPAGPSRDAGGFLCNHVFYVLMHMGVRGGFVHVSPLDVLPAETLVHAARVIVRTCAEPRSAS